tara:strand:- start:51 stop:197 length:147 start_codon:yes stop_codon:yes gene_type:complete
LVHRAEFGAGAPVGAFGVAEAANLAKKANIWSGDSGWRLMNGRAPALS